MCYFSFTTLSDPRVGIQQCKIYIHIYLYIYIPALWRLGEFFIPRYYIGVKALGFNLNELWQVVHCAELLPEMRTAARRAMKAMDRAPISDLVQ